LLKAGLLEKCAPKTYRATKEGLGFLQANPDRITVADLNTLPAFQAWKKTFGTKTDAEPEGSPPKEVEERTPQELLDEAMFSLNAELRSRLLEAILKQSPEFFERLVLDVLVKMGYGGSRENAAQHLGKSGDEGIDGRINQDPLGLDQIMVQA